MLKKDTAQLSFESPDPVEDVASDELFEVAQHLSLENEFVEPGDGLGPDRQGRLRPIVAVPGREHIAKPLGTVIPSVFDLTGLAAPRTQEPGNDKIELAQIRSVELRTAVEICQRDEDGLVETLVCGIEEPSKMIGFDPAVALFEQTSPEIELLIEGELDLQKLVARSLRRQRSQLLQIGADELDIKQGLIRREQAPLDLGQDLLGDPQVDCDVANPFEERAGGRATGGERICDCE